MTEELSNDKRGEAARERAWTEGPKVVFDRVGITRTLLVANAAPTVYRLWEWPGAYEPGGDVVPELLYVGRSMKPRARLLAHLRSGRVPTAAIFTVERFRNPMAMARAERLAIKIEQPLHNCHWLASD